MTYPMLIPATIAVLALLSRYAALRVAPGAARLTMHWKPDGTPTWTLPRNAALAFTPLLTAATLIIIWFVDDTGRALPFVCAAFIGAHLLHLVLLAMRS